MAKKLYKIGKIKNLVKKQLKIKLDIHFNLKISSIKYLYGQLKMIKI